VKHKSLARSLEHSISLAPFLYLDFVIPHRSGEMNLLIYFIAAQ
jgi:hypothetical protein